MTLSSNHLRDKLREICDVDYSAFAGFPTTRDRARAAWAAAFDDYISTIEEQIPRPPPPPNSHPSLLLTAVRSTFESTIQLAPTTSAADAAADFAGAWEASIGAITPGPPASDSALATWLFASFTNVSPLGTALRSSLTTLFQTPTTTTVQRLGDIAAAFHTATSGLIAATTFTATGATPVPMTPMPVQ